MEDKHKNSASSWRHFLWRVMTVLMFFYLCANVSVLEYFGGNPLLGIMSYRQVVEANPQSPKTSETAFARSSIDDFGSSKSDKEEDIPFDGDDCFCCSSHAIINYASLIVPLEPVVNIQRDPNFFYRPDHSNWQTTTLYRPPRTA